MHRIENLKYKTKNSGPIQYLAQKMAHESSSPSIWEMKHKPSTNGHAVEPILANISLMWGVCTIPCVIVIRHTIIYQS